MAINLYAVGIYFRKSIPFKADPGKTTMSGASLLKAAQAANPTFSYKLDSTGMLVQVSYVPQSTADFPSNPKNTGLIGYTLALADNLVKFPEPAGVLQYTSSLPPTTPTAKRPPFASNGFADNSDIRIRLLSIYRA
jgi:hypothetical protein